MSQAWVREAPPGAITLAGYALVSNNTDKPMKIVAASSEDFASVELHRSLLSGGIASMHKVPAVNIAPKGSVRFEPGDLHLMLMQPVHPLNRGDKVNICLYTASQDKVCFDAFVENRGAAG